MDKKEKKVPASVRVLGLKNLVLQIASFCNLKEIARLTTIQKSTWTILKMGAADQFYQEAFQGWAYEKAQTFLQEMRTRNDYRSSGTIICCCCCCCGMLVTATPVVDLSLYICRDGCLNAYRHYYQMARSFFSRARAIEYYRQTR
jgi:hypothetical protein